ncbi:hypothetical protein VTO42DRAFT_8563 [Malbranchea cinnamomea]
MAEDVDPNKEQPLAGVTLCCTSILPELRGQLAAIATEMGALHKFDLTSDVTHLIVGEINTPKYKYVARERSDVKVLRAEWVEAVREAWMLGGDVDLEALEEQYRYPTFAGLAICLTGFEDMDFRNRLQELVIANGGDFRRDLTKDVTHLVARAPEGQKYKFATLWNIKTVSLKWLEESIERGMVLEESLYDPLLPVEKQGVGAWNRAVPRILEKRPKPVSAGGPRPRKLRRVASVKLGDQNEGIWTDIVGHEAAVPSISTNGNAGILTAAHGQSNSHPRPVLQEAKSFASETTLFDRPGSVTQETAPITLQEKLEPPRGIWHECTFLIYGFTPKQVKILRSHLLSHDARIVSSLQELLDTSTNPSGTGIYILVPYNLPRSQMPSIDEDTEPHPEIVTDMWIEKCLHSHSFVPPESHITSTPVPRFPIPAFQGMTICSTGFSGIDLLHLSKLVKLLGATYDEYLTSNASVLICQNMQPNKEKLRHVKEWNIPAVIADWLWISVQTGEKKPFDRYLIPYRGSTQSVEPNSKDRNDNDVVGKKPHVLGKPTKHPLPPPAGERARSEDRTQGKNSPQHDSKNQADDNALQELPAKPTRQQTRSPSPSKETRVGDAQTVTQPRAHLSRTDSSGSGLSAPLEMAISELLKQKRRRANATDKDNTQPQRRRRQLLGRASSNCSTLVTAGRASSRASSIDTINEDGYGTAIEGLNSPSTRGQNGRAQSFISGRKNPADNQSDGQQPDKLDLDFFRAHHNNLDDEYGGREGDDEIPQMTQLGYEDPDAEAMREQIMQHAEKMSEAAGAGAGAGDGGTTTTTTENRGTEKQSDGNTGRSLVIGRLQDTELLAGWGGGRRTRSAKNGSGK